MKPTVTVKIGDSGSKIAHKTYSVLLKLDRNVAKIFWRCLKAEIKRIGAKNDLVYLNVVGQFAALRVEND